MQARNAMEKILFVLPSGGVVFLRVAPARAASTTASRYVQRWAIHHHPTGGLLLPDPDDAVTERDEMENRASHRRWFRFVSPKTWGFHRQKDGRWAWIDPNPAR